MGVIWIAEIGVNHLGDLDKAIRMINKAANAGATAVKFQMYDPIKVLGKDSPYLQDAHQFTKKQLEDLASLSHACSLQFGCSVFNVQDIDWASQFDFMKIASRMNRNQEFIAKCEATKLPVYMSIQPNTQINYKRFKHMWCVTKYPSTVEDLSKYNYNKFGLSSHCPDIQASIAAYKNGARVFEHHVKESDFDKGCDMAASITFDDYQELISKCAS